MTEEKIRTATNKIIRMAYDIKRENPSMSLDNAFKAIELWFVEKDGCVVHFELRDIKIVDESIFLPLFAFGYTLIE